MDNKITGYRDLSQDEVYMINVIKAKSEELGNLITGLRVAPNLDQHRRHPYPRGPHGAQPTTF